MLNPLSEVCGLKDPAKQFEVDFVISELPAVLLAKNTQKLVATMSGNSAIASMKEIRLRCSSYGYPGTKIETTDIFLGHHRKKVGTVQNKSGTWNVKVTEDYQGSVLNIIQAWCDLIHSNILGTRLPSSMYTTTACITLGERINSNDTKRTIHLKGVWPVGYKVNNIDPSSSKPIDVDISFNYDYFAENSYSLLSWIGTKA